MYQVPRTVATEAGRLLCVLLVWLRPVSTNPSAWRVRWFLLPFTYTLNQMLYYALKIGISALVIVAIAEIAKRSSGFAALLASLPLTSLLAFVWLHIEGTESARIADLSGQIFWLVLPSLVLFLLLPLLLRQGLGFWLSAFDCGNRCLLLRVASFAAQVRGAVVIYGKRRKNTRMYRVPWYARAAVAGSESA